MADDLGWKELGCYGQEKIRTPHIDQLAAEGIRFTQYYAGSVVCAPSRCNLITGMHGGHAYIRDNGEKDNVIKEYPDIAEKIEAIMFRERSIPSIEKFHFGNYRTTDTQDGAQDAD